MARDHRYHLRHRAHRRGHPFVLSRPYHCLAPPRGGNECSTPLCFPLWMQILRDRSDNCLPPVGVGSRRFIYCHVPGISWDQDNHVRHRTYRFGHTALLSRPRSNHWLALPRGANRSSTLRLPSWTHRAPVETGATAALPLPLGRATPRT